MPKDKGYLAFPFQTTITQQKMENSNLIYCEEISDDDYEGEDYEQWKILKFLCDIIGSVGLSQIVE